MNITTSYIGRASAHFIPQNLFPEIASLHIWAGADANRLEAADRILAFYHDPIGCENRLDLSGLNLTELPPGIEYLPHLENLDLDSNHLTE